MLEVLAVGLQLREGRFDWRLVPAGAELARAVARIEAELGQPLPAGYQKDFVDAYMTPEAPDECSFSDGSDSWLAAQDASRASARLLDVREDTVELIKTAVGKDQTAFALGAVLDDEDYRDKFE